MECNGDLEKLRPRLFALAYRMLGARADAEDVVQNAYLRWQSLDKNKIRSPDSYLMTIVARLSLDALKSAQRKRETYVGPWLPEPLVEPLGTRPLEMAESLSLAFLHLLEALSPAERVAFLMRDAFDADYSEVAATLDTTEENCRQLVARARKHLQGRRPRFPVDRELHQKVLREFLAASARGDPARLAGLLSQDVIVYSDGGGKVRAALNPISGPDRVSRLLTGLARKGAAAVEVRFVEVNGTIGALLAAGSLPASIITLDIDSNGLVRRVYIVNNPDKLPQAVLNSS
jgi:RNA polymerase sigma-70 factor, ECF subfamily